LFFHDVEHEAVVGFFEGFWFGFGVGFECFFDGWVVDDCVCGGRVYVELGGYSLDFLFVFVAGEESRCFYGFSLVAYIAEGVFLQFGYGERGIVEGVHGDTPCTGGDEEEGFAEAFEVGDHGGGAVVEADAA
jgi:hypothetical protein